MTRAAREGRAGLLAVFSVPSVSEAVARPWWLVARSADAVGCRQLAWSSHPGSESRVTRLTILIRLDSRGRLSYTFFRLFSFLSAQSSSQFRPTASGLLSSVPRAPPRPLRSEVVARPLRLVAPSPGGAVAPHGAAPGRTIKAFSAGVRGTSRQESDVPAPLYAGSAPGPAVGVPKRGSPRLGALA